MTCLAEIRACEIDMKILLGQQMPGMDRVDGMERLFYDVRRGLQEEEQVSEGETRTLTWGLRDWPQRCIS